MTINEDYLKSNIRAVDNWPKPGITFRDISTLLENPPVFQAVIDTLTERYQNAALTHIAALDARGFLLGSTLAYQLNKPLVMLRKKGKLPPDTVSQNYQLEYGTATLEVSASAFGKDNQVLLVDDLIATGGTLLAAYQLIRQAGATVVEAAAIIDLPELGGSQLLQKEGVKVFTLCTFRDS